MGHGAGGMTLPWVGYQTQNQKMSKPVPNTELLFQPIVVHSFRQGRRTPRQFRQIPTTNFVHIDEPKIRQEVLTNDNICGIIKAW